MHSRVRRRCLQLRGKHRQHRLSRKLGSVNRLQRTAAIHRHPQKSRLPLLGVGHPHVCLSLISETLLGNYYLARYYEESGQSKKAMRTYQSAYMLEEIGGYTKDDMFERADQIKRDFGY